MHLRPPKILRLLTLELCSHRRTYGYAIAETASFKTIVKIISYFSFKGLRIPATILFVIWFVLKFLLHKSGYVHAILLGAIAMFVIQLVQDRRTEAYHIHQ